MKTTLNFIFILIFFSLPAISGLALNTSSHHSKRGTPAASAGTYKLIGIKVTGTQRYTEKDILPASGLQLGQDVGEADFKEAVQRLGESGVFQDVAYSYSYSGVGTRLELQLKDVEAHKLVPARFENFVWFTDSELQSELEKRVPLFKQLLPAGGALPDRVSAALQDILAAKQLPDHVDYLREGNPDGGDLTGIAYRVTDVDIQIHNLEFPGASPEEAAALETIGRRLTGARYLRSTLAVAAQLDLLPVFLQRGYLKASFGLPQARVVKGSESGSASDLEVDVILPVTPGKVYSVSEVVWQGNSAVKTEDLQRLIHLPSGKPADAGRLASDLEAVSRLYRGKGYMAAKITPQATMDDEKSTVRYHLNVVEGDQYKMGELEIVGLDTQATARLQQAWTLRQGDPYNAGYARKFLDETNRFLPRDVPWSAAVHESVNTQDKTVDVTIRFHAS